jgi:GNAT superfamily N-acetyltransferase
VNIQIAKAREEHLAEIFAWLRAEEEQCGEGFYCHRDVIVSSFEAGEVYCAFCEGQIAGFVVHNRKSIGSAIDLLEVRPELRGRGLGKLLADDVTERLFAMGTEFIEVQCAPRSSERFWRNRGFTPVKNERCSPWDAPRLILFRPADRTSCNAQNRPA